MIHTRDVARVTPRCIGGKGRVTQETGRESKELETTPHYSNKTSKYFRTTRLWLRVFPSAHFSFFLIDSNVLRNTRTSVE